MRDYFVWLAKFLTIIVFTCFAIPLMIGAVVAVAGMATIGEEIGAKGDKSVALVNLEGVIINSREVVAELHKWANDKDIDGIVLRINSPGGSVSPSQEIFNTVKMLKAKKPIVASMATVAASGGLYAALSASKVYAEPGTMTGSIGVIAQLPNFSKVADIVGVDVITIKSGQLKDVGNQFREMTTEDKKFLQKTVDVLHDEFTSSVATSRNLSLVDVKKFADGRVILGSQALELGLIDEYGGLYEAARGVYEVLGEPLPEGKYPEIIEEEDPFKEFVELLEAVTYFPKTFLSREMQFKYQMM